MLIMLNSRNRNHAEIYKRSDAFYDLNRGLHVDELEMLDPGVECCVISYEDEQDRHVNVVLEYWIYDGHIFDRTENACVMIGKRVDSKVIKKRELATDPKFAGVLNCNGNFNRFCIKTCA